MGVKKVPYSKLSPSGKWMRANPQKVKQESSRNKPLSAKDKKDKVESQRMRRKAVKEGRDIKDKDWDHHTGKFESVQVNRGRPGTGGRTKGMKKNFAMKPGSKNIDSPTTFRQDSPLKELGFTDTATQSQRMYSQPSVQQGNAARTPLYDREKSYEEASYKSYKTKSQKDKAKDIEKKIISKAKKKKATADKYKKIAKSYK